MFIRKILFRKFTPLLPANVLYYGSVTDERRARMNDKRKTAAFLLSILLLCNLAFIWGNSLVTQAESHDLSVGVLNFLPDFVKALFPNQEQLVHFVRKLAHFTEFACLGGLSAGLLALFHKVSFHLVVHLFCCGFFVAAIDETIQIFTGRGSQLQDVWLDFAGFVTGLVLVLGVRAIACRKHQGEAAEPAPENIISFPEEQARRKNKAK